jgi:hydrogenase large subunit
MASPITRGCGLLSIQVTVERGRVAAAQVIGGLYRGWERILVGRDPADAPYLTERICGICSAAHATAASVMLDDACGVEVPARGRLLRNLMLGAEFLQNHLRHFYLMVLPDYIEGPPEQGPADRAGGDRRFSRAANQRLLDHYWESIGISQDCHQMLGLLGAKAPHAHGIVPGGAAVDPGTDVLNKLASLLAGVRSFLEERLLPDTSCLAAAYPDYFGIGVGPGGFLSYGGFPDRRGVPAFTPGVVRGGRREGVDIGSITESLRRTWLEAGEVPAPYRSGAYSWVEAVRYQGEPMEVGPLARAMVGGEGLNSSVMDRIMARSREAGRIAGWMSGWLDGLGDSGPAYLQPSGISRLEAFGAVEAPRGSLLHRVRVEDGRIAEYKLITPSEWNFSPADERGRPGVVERSLIGTPVFDPGAPVEVGRVARSFDPCLYCAAHVING